MKKSETKKRDIYDYLIRSVVRALDVFNVFILSNEKELGVTTLSYRLKLPKNNVFRLLTTLSYQGYIEQNPVTGNYRLGLRCLELGQAYLRRMGLVSQAHDVLDRLATKTMETAYLSVCDRGEVVYVDMMETCRPVRIVPMIGRRASLFCTSAGKVQVAYKSPEEIRKLLKEVGLKRYTQNTIVSESEMLKHLEMVRKQGYAIDNEEYEEDVKCVGAPVWDYTENVVAGVCISGPVNRMSNDRIEKELVPLVKNAAMEISRRLGYGVESS
ncbi:MAG: IclR family transcriptional regulator [bacterium]|nr:IclR family transcriptional regulator [bacterium]